MNTQVCRKCKKLKPIENFYFRKDNNKYRFSCKSCDNKRDPIKRAEYYEKNALYYVKRHLKCKYGITLEQKQALFDTQAGKCAVCFKLFETLSLACIDHNHKTGQIRGLLCDMCNTAYGQLKENVGIINNLLKYHDKYNKAKSI